MAEAKKDWVVVPDQAKVSAFVRSLKTMGQKPVILVDMDGVMFDWSGHVRSKLHGYIPENQHKTHEEIHSFYLEDVYEDKYAQHVIRTVMKAKGLYANLKPIEGSVEAVKKLHELGYPVFFCSAPEVDYEDQMCWSEKAQSIEKHLGHDWTKRTILTKDKTLVNGNILVDDKPPTMIKGAVPPIWYQLLFDQPYNQKGAYEHTWRGRWKELFDVLGETL